MNDNNSRPNVVIRPHDPEPPRHTQTPPSEPHRTFNISDTLREGWELTNGFKGTAWLGIALYIVLSIVLELLLGSVLGFNTTDGFGAVLAGAILFPLTIGIGILGIKRAAGEDIDAMDVFASYSFTLPLIIGYFLYLIAVVTGMLLLILPGIYLSVMLVWFGQIIVLKNQSAVEAMKESYRRMKGNFWAYFAIGLILGIIIILSALPLGIGLIWTLPWAIATAGVMFNRLFDDQSETF